MSLGGCRVLPRSADHVDASQPIAVADEDVAIVSPDQARGSVSRFNYMGICRDRFVGHEFTTPMPGEPFYRKGKRAGIDQTRARRFGSDTMNE